MSAYLFGVADPVVLQLGTSIVEATSEAGLLDKLVSGAKELTGSMFSVALFLGSDGMPSLMSHLGMSSEQVARLPHLPRPIGLVGVVLEGETLRLSSTREHPRAIGLPETHAAMGPILALPMKSDGDVMGAIYLARRVGAPLYTAQDEHLVRLVADATGRRVRQIRRQTAADLLNYQLSSSAEGSTSHGETTSSIRRLLKAARHSLGTDLAFVSRIVDGEQQLLYVDALPHAPDLPEGTRFPASTGYCAMMLDGSIPTSVPDLTANEHTAALDITTALDLGAYCGSPITLPDGTLFGTLCGINGGPTPALTGAQTSSLQTIAQIIGTELAVQRQADEASTQARNDFARQLTVNDRSIHLQPIVSLQGQSVAGYEALSRFADSWGNLRRPDMVFAEAGRYGLGIQLEIEMMQRALSYLDLLPPTRYLSVNLSPDAIMNPATFDLLTAAVVDHPGQLVLELTEHEQVADYPALLRVLSGLRQRGLRLAIDDTGAGYSSLQHVTTMNPDILKLDIAFVRDIHLDPSRRAVARAMIGFAHDIGASLVAEGVETDHELEVITALGATHGQGYLLGRPASAETQLNPLTEALSPASQAGIQGVEKPRAPRGGDLFARG